jgi:hypothetical protein
VAAAHVGAALFCVSEDVQGAFGKKIPGRKEKNSPKNKKSKKMLTV